MTTGNLNTINFNTPFLQGVPNSRVAPEWIRLLGSIFTAVAQNSVAVEGDTLSSRTLSATSMNQLSELAALSLSRKSLPALLTSQDDFNASRAKTSSGSNAVLVADDTATNGTMYPMFANGIAGHLQVKTSSSKWTYNPSTGRITATQLVATGAFGCNGQTPQTAFASGGAAPAGGTGTAAGGWDTAAHRDAAITLLNNIRSALVANGIMS